jgi:hypothetical protein
MDPFFRGVAIGVFAGSALRWLVLSAGVGMLRRGLPATAVRAVNIA